jgi:catechol 2,3-dioxygenase-like lactoylglutathione lyase family enzyme
VINAFHVLLSSSDADADRAFIRDVLDWPFVMAHGEDPGWLIFELPPTELGVHPGVSGAEGLGTTIHLICDDMASTVAELRAHGVEVPEPEQRPYGLVTAIPLPSGATLGLLEADFPSPLAVVRDAIADRADERRPAPPRPVPNKHEGLEFSISATVLESRDANALADFYESLLGWRRVYDEPGWAMLRAPQGGTGLSFNTDPLYEPPIWPATGPHQQMQAHLDVLVSDLSRGVQHALAHGARLAEHQPQEHVRVFLDPAGHPFCFFDENG